MKFQCSVYMLKQRKNVSSTEFNNMRLILSFLFTGFLYKKRVLNKNVTSYVLYTLIYSNKKRQKL